MLPQGIRPNVAAFVIVIEFFNGMPCIRAAYVGWLCRKEKQSPKAKREQA
jgi:hypothetical protein